MFDPICIALSGGNSGGGATKTIDLTAYTGLSEAIMQAFQAGGGAINVPDMNHVAFWDSLSDDGNFIFKLDAITDVWYAKPTFQYSKNGKVVQTAFEFAGAFGSSSSLYVQNGKVLMYGDAERSRTIVIVIAESKTVGGIS